MLSQQQEDIQSNDAGAPDTANDGMEQSPHDNSPP